jgi:triose/dihydroxyacetone kinase / FAD-AMP lyase (cyclizing)
MKKLINRPERVVDEMVEGTLALHPGLARLSHHNVLVRLDREEVRERQIALISGGGSGHEPAHAGYVGAGMLSAAVAGQVFTSPSADSVLAAIKAVSGRPGVLLIVKNYTGDRLNFGLAAEMARAQGISVETVVVADDVALSQTEETAGRRGLAGTVLIHKIAGAAAAAGMDLPQVASIAQAAADNLGTMGVSLSAGISPTVGEASFTLGENEMELGLGIHGEPGVQRVALRPADEIVDGLVMEIVSALQLRAGKRVAALINNLGSTTTMELAIVARRVLITLESHGLITERLYCGTFLSSLEMAGISLSLLRVDHERLKWLDAPTTAPAWPCTSANVSLWRSERIIPSESVVPPRTEHPIQTEASAKAKRAVTAACDALLEAEHQLTEMDRIVGDGDLGSNLARSAQAIKNNLPYYPFDDLPGTLKTLGVTLQETLGGSSGPLYGVLLLRTGIFLEGGPANDPQRWGSALLEGCGAISELGGAREGDRTMLDALLPFAQTFHDGIAAGASTEDSLKRAMIAAEAGAEATAQMIPRRGRSSYLGERAMGHADPGATAVVIWLRAVLSALP